MLRRPRALARASQIAARGGRQVEIDDLARAAPVDQLLGQHDAGIARAAARDQGAKGPVEVEPAGEEVVIDLEDVARRAGDQPHRLLARVARRIGQRLVLGANLVQRLGNGHYEPWFMLQIPRP